MTDEEKQIFEEWFEEKKEKCEVYGNGDDFWVDDEIKKFCLMGYEQGLKAGRPQWHDLRKDPNDLPKKNGEYFCKVNSHWEKYGVKHFTLQPYGYNRQWEGQGYSVIAWCEIPTFDKE